MKTIELSADGQAIALACSTLGLGDGRALKPLKPAEWHGLASELKAADMNPRDLLGSDAQSLQSGLAIAPDLAERLATLMSRGGQLAFELERLASRGIWVLTRADKSYPDLLKKRLGRTMPPLLFGAGSQSCFELPALAVVGSRDVDDEGLAYAEELARRCARQHVAVISGAARGVDSAAMNATLEAGGSAVGITVEPLEQLVRRRDLRLRLEEGALALATPFHPAARWHAGNAMRRNRLVYAMAQAAVVVASSPESGGTRAGALENLKARWVPVWVRDDGTAGNRGLIGEGARPLPAAGIADMEIEELFIGVAPPSLLDAAPETSGDETPAAAHESSDLFSAVWPKLREYLREPRTERDVADRFGLELTQARAWLKRAATDELVEVKKRPQRYVVKNGAQHLLFGS